MNTFTIGRTTDGAQVSYDLEEHIKSRLLINANSGGGKSYLMRLIAENSAVQFVVLDPEGEFYTLREQLKSVLLVGSRGDIQTDPKTAKVLARRLLENGASAVIDLSDLDRPGSRQYVRYFLESLMSAPQDLWRPMIIFIDEAHLFCPERSSGEAESLAAVVSLMSMGRKRQFAGVLATQRLSKLHKDAAAECSNVIIGKTVLDVDVKRALDILGMSMSERQSLRELNTGEFFGYGPALSGKGVVRFNASLPKTAAPKRGSHATNVAPGSSSVQKMISELADLAKRDEGKPLTMEEAEMTIARLKREINAKPKAVASSDEIQRAADRGATERDKHWQGVIKVQTTGFRRLQEIAIKAHKALTEGIGLALPEIPEAVPTPQYLPRTYESTTIQTSRSTPKPSQAAVYTSQRPSDSSLGRCERAVLAALAQHGDSSKNRIGILAGYSPTSGGFNNSLSKLRSAGYVSGSGDNISITNAGNNALGEYEPLPTGDDLHRYWYNKLSKSEAAILKVLVEAQSELTKDQIGAATGYSSTSGGFNNSLSRLRTLELIEGYGQIKASDSLF